MKKTISILSMALFSCSMTVNAQTNYLTKLQLPNQYQIKDKSMLTKQTDLYAFANPQKVHEIQSMNLVSSKSKSGIGGLTVGGIIVAAIGVGLLAGGLTMVKNAGGQTTYTNDNGQETGSLQGGLGAVMAAGGALLTVGGTAMIIIGVVHHKHSGRRH